MESRRRKNRSRSPRSSTLQSGNQPHSGNIGDDRTEYQYRCQPYRSSRLQKQSHRRINEFLDRNNYRSLVLRKNQTPSPECTEEEEEEERKKKVSDTANKLLSKIRTWAGDKDALQEEAGAIEHDVLDLQNDSSRCVQFPEAETTVSRKLQLISVGQKPKRIAHSRNKTSLCRLKKLGTRSVNEVTRKNGASRKLDVNKATVRDFQNRIQHKLINEIMQMPKINLQNMLNNPGINPLMQVKISHLVKENRLLIAQKLRALAESKMNSKDSARSSQFLVDIDKLIDPVVETDLSVLPLDLIKQMENIFQVQFDYSDDKVNGEGDGPEPRPRTTEAPPAPVTNQTSEDSNSCTEIANPNPQNDVGPPQLSEMGDCRGVQMERFSSLDIVECESANDDVNDSKCAEDLAVYECSTDEDDEEPEAEAVLPVSNHGQQGEPGEKVSAALLGTGEYSREQENSTLDESPADGRGGVTSDKGDDVETQAVETTELGVKSPSPECESRPRSPPAFLYGVPVPSESKDETCSSLLREASAIQHLVNRLNERRFMIFLKLARIQAHGQFIQGSFTQHNFVETVTNGSIYLADKLNKYFTSQGISHGGRYKRPKRRKKRSERFKQ